MSQLELLLSAEDPDDDTPTDSAKDDREDSTKIPEKKRKLKIILFCLGVFVLLLVAAGISLGVLLGATNLFHNHDKNRNYNANSPSSGNIVNSKVLDYINESYDPCDNFYAYSCGRWNNTIPDELSEWGTFDELAFDTYYKLAGYLSQNISSGDPDAVKKSKYIYSACTDIDFIEDNYVNRSISFMVSKGGWQNGNFFPFQSWSINNSLYNDHYFGSVAFFSFDILPDDMDSSKQVIWVMI